MAHNAYVRAAGVWNLLSVLLSSEMATFDLRQYQAINGDLGGTWTPAAAIIIGGASGLHVTGPCTLDDADVTITTGKKLTVNLGGAIDALVGSVADFAGTWNIKSGGAGSIKSGGSLTVDSGGTLTVKGTTALIMFAASTSTQQAGATLDLNGQTNLKSGGFLTVRTGATLSGETGTTLAFVAGSTVTLAGTNTLSGTQTISGTTSLGGATTVPNAATVAFAAGSAMSAAATAPFTLNNVTTCNGTINVTSGATLEIQASAIFTTTHLATVTRGADETRTGSVTLSGIGAYLNVRVEGGLNGDATYDGSDFDILTVPALSANTVYTFADLGASDRVLLTVERNSNVSGNTLTLRRDDLTDFATFASSVGGAAQIYWNGTTWGLGVFSAGVSP